MSNEKIGLGIGIESTADTTGADKMADALDKTAKKAKDAGDAAQKAKTDFAALGEGLVSLIEGAGLIEFLKESVQQFYEDEKAIRAVAGAAQIWGQDAGKAKDEADKFAKSMSLLSGISDDKLTSALGKQYLALGDMAQAQSRVALATDIATRMGWDFEKAMTTVEQAVNGQGKELSKLVPEIKAARDQHEAAKIAVDGLEKRFRGATATTKDHALAVDQSRVKWEQFTKEVGGVVLPMLTGLRSGFVSATEAVVDLASRGVARVIELGGYIGALGGLLKNVWTGPKEAVAAFVKDIARAQREYTEASEALDDEAYRKERAHTVDLVDVAKKAADTKVAINADLHKKTAKQLDETQRYDLKTYYDTLDKHQKAYTKHVEWMRKEGLRINKEVEKDVKEHWKTQEDIMRASTHAMAKNYAALAKQKLELETQVANGVIALAGEQFGIQKELAIAVALINTFEGATKALAQGGTFGPALAALVVAAGMIEIAQISSQDNPTATLSQGSVQMMVSASGFDDPANDRAAYLGGRKWANDMIGNFSKGISQGWAEGMRGGGGGSPTTITNNNQRNTTLNVSMQDANSVEHAKKLIRTLRMVDRNIIGQANLNSKRQLL